MCSLKCSCLVAISLCNICLSWSWINHSVYGANNQVNHHWCCRHIDNRSLFYMYFFFTFHIFSDKFIIKLLASFLLINLLVFLCGWVLGAQMLLFLIQCEKWSHLDVFTHLYSFLKVRSREKMGIFFVVERKTYFGELILSFSICSINALVYMIERWHFRHHCHQPCAMSLWWLFLCLVS